MDEMVRIQRKFTIPMSSVDVFSSRSIFSEWKYVWVSVVHAFTKDNLTILIMERNFSRVFKMAWDEITGSAEKTTRKGVNAFQWSGIFPFDSEAVDYS